MKQVTIDDRIFLDPSLTRLVVAAGESLNLELTTSRIKDEVSASWTLDVSETGARRIVLTIFGEGPPVVGIFSTADLENSSRVHEILRRLWGDYLQNLSRKLVQEMTESSRSDRFLDGPDALERIIDSMTEYSEREGHEPVSLKLPVRYAAALMKLGPEYWGDFYQGIQKLGLRAFAGETVLGMKVELVPDINAPLEVA